MIEPIAEISVGLWTLLGIVGVAAILALWAIGVYNQLIALRNGYKNAFAQVDVQLKRRYDLIPNLVETAKGYLKHERETLEAVVLARNAAQTASRQAAANPGDPRALHGLSAAEAALAGTMTRFFALAENYPDLKANQNMIALQQELSATENQIASARQTYNVAVTSYNTAREQFPASLVAGVGSFGPAELFEVARDEEREPVQVKF